jgi:hypothetical protein
MEKTLINIDSRTRDYSLYPSSTYFKLGSDNQINNNINYLNYKNINSIMLSSAEIPNDFYAFSSYKFNNFMKITCTLNNDIIDDTPCNDEPLVSSDCDCESEEDHPEPVQTIEEGTYDVVLPDGNYNSNELVNKLNMIFNKLKLNIGKITISDGLIISFDSHSNIGSAKFDTIEVSCGIAAYYDKNSNRVIIKNLSKRYEYLIDFNNYNQYYVALGYMLGFRNKIYTLDVSPLESHCIKATHAVDTDGEKYIFLRINDYGNILINHVSPFKVLSKIILDRDNAQTVFNNAGNYIYNEYKFRQPTDINKLEIELLDYTGNRINNYGSDFSITLELVQIYDEHQYVSSLNSLKLTNKPIGSLSSVAYLDNSNHIVNTEKKSTKEILSKIFEEKSNPEILPIDEIVSLEDKRNKKEKRDKKKKKKFGFEYISTSEI